MTDRAAGPVAPRRVAGGRASGAVYAHGATVTSWQPAGHGETLFVSNRSHFEPGVPIRGGIPVCFPWFGTGPAGDRQPMHGPVRLVEWAVADDPPGAAGGTVRLRLDRAADPSVADAVPSGVTVQLVVDFGSQLAVDLVVANDGSASFDFEAALHTYLRVGDVRQVRVDGLDGAGYVDRVAGGAEPTQRGPVTFAGETDRVYRYPGPVTVVDPVLDRRLHVTTSGAACTVVWNPGAAKAAGMADLGDDEWPEFVCIEAAAVREAAVRLEPGQRHTVGYRLAVDTADPAGP